MTNRVLLLVNRMLDSSGEAVRTLSSGARGRRRAKDFMVQDVTGSARFYGR